MTKEVNSREKIINAIVNPALPDVVPIRIAIRSAMDQFASQEAIGFVEWVEEYGMFLQSGVWKCRHPESRAETLTTAELYDLYKQTV